MADVNIEIPSVITSEYPLRIRVPVDHALAMPPSACRDETRRRLAASLNGLFSPGRLTLTPNSLRKTTMAFRVWGESDLGARDREGDRWLGERADSWRPARASIRAM